jgi:hypothetical protein
MKEQDIPEEIKKFEQALEKYTLTIEYYEKQEYIALAPKILKQTKQAADALYQAASELFAFTVDIAQMKDDKYLRKFMQNITEINKSAESAHYFPHQRKKDIEEVERQFWSLKPALKIRYDRRKSQKVKLKLKNEVNANTKDYLLEAENSLNAGAPKAAIVMAGAALEKRLRKIHDAKVGRSAGIKLWKVMENLENTNAFKNEGEKTVLQLCKLFRNFCAHPSTAVVNDDSARMIVKSVESFVNSEITED